MDKDFTEIHNDEFANAKWFADGKINVSENCIDRHLEDKSEKKHLFGKVMSQEIQNHLLIKKFTKKYVNFQMY